MSRSSRGYRMPNLETKMESASSVGDSELVALLAAAVQKRRARRVARTVAVWRVVLRRVPDDDTDEDDAPPVKRTRRVLPRRDYKASFWWNMLASPGLGDPGSREAKVFRRRFRIPHKFFTEVVALVKAKKWFPLRADAAGRQCIPVELKVLASLHILGRGNFFDDITQMSHISEPVVQSTFHRFNKLFAQELCHEHVHLPTPGEDQDQVMEHYDLVGFTGATGSTDVTHIKWAACPYSWAKQYTGKEGFATIAYQAIVDHTGRLLAATKGYAGSMNDKTIIQYDAAIKKIKQDPIYAQKEYTLYDEDGEPFQRKGNYSIVDNGYNQWEILIPPSKFADGDIEIRWSKALESVRKDVECFFGILKGRFRILKLGILFQCLEDIDNMFFTCCTLHNMLHAYDGLDELEPAVEWGEGGSPQRLGSLARIGREYHRKNP
ncbi:unnamed protein product [Pylaiella littoralis]